MKKFFFLAATAIVAFAACSKNNVDVASIQDRNIKFNTVTNIATKAPISGTVTVAAPWAKVKEGTTNYDPAEAISGWEPGKKYNYTLCFKLNEITFNPAVTDWVEVELQTVNILD